MSVALSGLRFDVAKVVVAAGQGFQTGFFAKQILGFIERETSRTHNKRKSERIEVADTIVLRQAGLRTKSHARADSNAVEDSGDGGAAPQVTGNNAKRRVADG